MTVSLQIPCLFIVVPCYNEEDVLPSTSCMFLDKLRDLSEKSVISKDSRIIFVNDGSSDGTWDVIAELSAMHPEIEGISLSRNRGHQNALLAGLMFARTRCDVSISLDCDGQDDVNAIDEMLQAYVNGNDIVYGVRCDRSTDSFAKRFSAQSYYRFLKAMGVEAVADSADYRLISARALDALAEFEEVNLYLRGMVPLVGFKSVCVFYKRQERIAGESHYPIGKMLALAIDGITSLSVRPLRLIAYLGLIVSALSFIGVCYSLISNVLGMTVTGWTSLISIVCLLGGIQLFCLGVIGEYIGKIFLETKRRPRFIVEQTTLDE
ncbi:glycosyltransferase family 2 protein [Adlercreutzia sp. R25]|uniref:glycosyltransferase family 2 protein n=1 Tax=Adlercreutzia shanghongiae TaxID=3111773 RepID=UPI002DBF12BF|nr:glycosyltransferase family 2 protein [Adlercreutzia sp. R25]MEC4273300.1 glycosyltransferase family 2 protein [Adlercreutzia sp. R25]